MNIKETERRIIDKLNMYDDLVWYARKDDEMRKESETVNSHMTRIEELYPNEVEKLKGEHGDWEHGFNSGCLAAFRYYLDLRRESEEYANELFPDLDT